MKDVLEILTLIFGIAVLSLILARATEFRTVVEAGAGATKDILRTLLLYDYKKGG
ncbi:MAG: hypothetical protein NZ841_08480 [Dictyoglomus sp.]|nr:hypothetical protein [Dictyoglomus sp.]MDW8189318.1 hypothetical protein [Dictyoglomus sp.]